MDSSQFEVIESYRAFARLRYIADRRILRFLPESREIARLEIEVAETSLLPASKEVTRLLAKARARFAV